MQRIKRNRGLGVFLVVCFGLTIVLAVFLRNQLTFLVPAVAALVALRVERQPPQPWYPPLPRGKVGYYLLAWLLPLGLSVLGGILYYLIFPGNLDWQMSGMREEYASQGRAFTPGILFNDTAMMWTVAYVVRAVSTLGEEVGWRGYLLPRLSQKMGAFRATLAVGLVWALWHTALLPTFYGFGMMFWMGSVEYILSNILAAGWYTWLTIKTGSCIPAALAHCGYNTFNGVARFFMRAGAEEVPFLASGLDSWVILAPHFIFSVVCYVWLYKMERKPAEGAPEAV